PLNVSATVIGSKPLIWMFAVRWAVSSSGRFPSVSTALVSTDMIRLGKSTGSRRIRTPEAGGAAHQVALAPSANGSESGLGLDPAGDTGAHVGVDHAHHLERRAHFDAHAGSRIDRVDISGHHRKLACAEAEHGMTKTVNPVAFNVRHRTDSGEVEISSDH